MADPKTLTGMTTSMVAVQIMDDSDLSHEEALARAKEKERATSTWLQRAAGFAGVAVIIFCAEAWLEFKLVVADKSFAVLVLMSVVFLVVALLPVLASVYCATQASGEYMETFVKTLKELVGIGRKAAGKDSAP
jgi:hypothetical protein